MQNLINVLSLKKIFTIKDLCNITNKKSVTIRKWEKKGIINKYNHGANGWRQYTVDEFIDTLERILNYPWQRNTIYNKGQIQLLVNNLKKFNGRN